MTAKRLQKSGTGQTKGYRSDGIKKETITGG